MPKPLNVQGKTFGNLKFLRPAPDYFSIGGSRYFQSVWLCLLCGKERIARNTLVANGHTKSCGCLQPKRASECSRKPMQKGETYFRLTVLDSYYQNGDQFINCLCSCGNTLRTLATEVRNGHTKSCGCLQKETVRAMSRTHGQSGSRTCYAWCNMRRRCLDPKNVAYANYGGRGISVCQRWLDSFEHFLADMGECPPGLTIERLDNSKGYEPGNCGWKTHKAQSRNKRTNIVFTVRGITGCLAELAERFGVSYRRVADRLRWGWSLDDAFFAPRSTRGAWPKAKPSLQQQSLPGM